MTARSGRFARLGVLTTACVVLGVACAGRSVRDSADDTSAGRAGMSANGGGPSGMAGTSGMAGSTCSNYPRPGEDRGNGAHEDLEECDDGSWDGRDGCEIGRVATDATCPLVGPCTLDPCGNGWIASFEQCDDGNANDDDGCTAECQLEKGWYCPGAGLPCRPVCGDGRVVGDEECDDANPSSGDGCSRACRVEQTGCDGDCPLPLCGNGIASAPEDCDNGMRGNDGSYGGCNPDCTFSDYCGDGVVSATEECDWGADAESYGEGKCTTACRFAPYCGDGRVDVTFGEQCDDGPNPCVRGRGGCRECQYPLD